MKRLMLSIFLIFACAQAVTAGEMPGIQPGATAPDFEANDFRGDPVRLSDLYKQGPVILVFYRGSWCPYCNTHLQQLQSNLEQFKHYGANVVAVSVDKVDKATEAVEGHDLEFDVISNPEGDIIEKYGLVYHVPDELNTKYKEQYNIDLEGASGRTDHMIAIPATYVINTSGTVVFADANEDYKVRTSPEEIIQALEAMTSPAGIE